MARIFISYKRVDKDKVFKIKDQIESVLGEKCWIDLDGIESDAQFANVIIKAINECKVFLFMYSASHSQITDYKNDWTVRELDFAQHKKKRIVFVNLDASPLSDWFYMLFGTMQQVDARSKRNIECLISDLRNWLDIQTKEPIQKVVTGERNVHPIIVKHKKAASLVVISSIIFAILLIIVLLLSNHGKYTDREITWENEGRIADSLFMTNLPYISVDNSEKKRIIDQIINNLVYVEGGSFYMGTDIQDNIYLKDAYPAHHVELKSFYISKYELRQEEWIAIMHNNPSLHKGDNLPVENVSFYSVQEFLTKLSKLSGCLFRLPTEAEWEYSASGGKKSQHFRYSGSNIIDDVAWTWKDSGIRDFSTDFSPWDVDICNDTTYNFQTHPVGMKKANELGIYDMTGNVSEMCQDLYDEDFYKKSPISNPISTKGEFRIMRGGSFHSRIDFMCIQSRNSVFEDNDIDEERGFRIVMEPK